MKKGIFAMMITALMCSCSKTVINETVKDVKAVKYHVSNNDWAVTRSLEADGSEMADLWLFDYLDGELVASIHKSQGDADFDTPVVQMKYGQHHVYFVTSRGKTPTVSGTSITWATPSDTFWKDVEVDVNDGSASSIDVALDRVVTKLRISVTDKVPEGVSSIVVRPEVWWYGMDYVTGAAIESRNNERSIAVPESYVGTEGQLAVSVFGMSDDDEWMTDVSITARDGNGDVIGSVELGDVPFLRNRVTEASGSLFGSNKTFGITLNEEWMGPYTLEW